MSTTPAPTPNVLITELEQAIADTLNVAIPAFSQLGMVALFGAIQNLINHHAAFVKPVPVPNPAPILPAPNPAPVS